MKLAKLIIGCIGVNVCVGVVVLLLLMLAGCTTVNVIPIPPGKSLPESTGVSVKAVAGVETGSSDQKVQTPGPAVMQEIPTLPGDAKNTPPSAVDESPANG
jgi:hypothetical protein